LISIKNKTKRAFTLIELLVVISIIALLSSVVMVAVKDAREKAQIAKFKTEVGEFVKALEIYRSMYGYYPKCFNDYSTGGCYYLGIADYDGFSSNDRSTGLTILDQLKDQKLFTGNFITNKPSFLIATAIYNDVSLGTESEYDSFNPSRLQFTYGVDTVFNGKKSGDLKEYAFCLYTTDILNTTIDIGPIPNLSKNIIDGKYAYCSGN
jgi:prepilin-type N-terminal cleavage/methylation domain-containing protein